MGCVIDRIGRFLGGLSRRQRIVLILALAACLALLREAGIDITGPIWRALTDGVFSTV